MASAFLLVQLVATLFLVGLIWFVQVVHYPLMASVGPAEALSYARSHQRRTTYVVAPLMLVEAATACLLIWVRPEAVSLAPSVAGLVLLAVIWLSTFFWQVPIHAQLAREHRPDLVRRLVRSNWLRTFAWTARGVTLLVALAGLLATEAAVA